MLIALCGIASAASAFAASLGRQAPQAAIAIWPFAGEPYARAGTFAIALAAAKAGGRAVPADLPESIQDLSKEGLERAPVSAVAMRNLAMVRASRGDQAGAFALMQTAYRSSRRDPTVNLWLTDYHGRRGRDAQALNLYDITIRTDTAAAAQLMSTMATLVDNPAAIAQFEQLLAKDPPWIDDFWTAVLSREGNVDNAYRLRLAGNRRGQTTARSHDALLIQRLADSGRMEQAFTLYRSLAGRRASNEILADDSFDAKASFPPIGWKVESGSAFGSTINSKEGFLTITALPDAAGVVAQQLIELRGSGRYRLQASYSGKATSPLVLDLACADLGGANRLRKQIILRSGLSVIADLGSSCRFAWASLSLTPDDDPAGRDYRVDRISMRPVA